MSEHQQEQQYRQIPLDEFDAKIKTDFIEVSTSSLGGKVIACSDDFFASKDNLIKPTPSASMKGQFGPNGALYDGWESRRHNPSFDWVIILLAPPQSHLFYVDIDTSHFSGNEAPESSVFALRLEPGAERPVKLNPNDSRWQNLLPVVQLGPNSRHVFELGSLAKEGTWSALMVRMIPDGGMARFRAYGRPLALPVLPTLPSPTATPVNLLSPLISARIVGCSDANFSPPNNLLLPGRGHDMSDGWETRRSQVGRGKYGPGGPLEGQERKEWVVAKLGTTGVLNYIEIDTAYHVGNYPVACMVEATLSDCDVPPTDAKWTTIVAKAPLGPHRQHWLDIERNVPYSQVFSHVRCSIFPDGGLKRLRVFGHPIAPTANPPTALELHLPALPLTYEAFKPYGQVIQGWDLPTSAPKGIHVNIANQGTASKFHRLARVAEKYPEGALKKGGLAIGAIRAEPQLDVTKGAIVSVTTLERHACTTQAFIPLGKSGTELSPGGGFIIVVALNGKDDKPDVSTMRAFIATEAQGVSYDEGVWHHSLLTVNETLDYAVIEAQTGEVDVTLDCEKYTPPKPFARVVVAPFEPLTPPQLTTKPWVLIDRPSSLLPSISTTAPKHPVPITHEAFAPFGSVIRVYPSGGEPSGSDTNVAMVKDKYKVIKHDRLAPITNTYPADAEAVTGVAVFRATKKVGLERGKVFDVRLMERHPYTSQAFIPMGKAEWKGKGESKLHGSGSFLVVVAANGPDDRPDPATLQSFIMEPGTGLSYHPGTWHHPVLVLDETLDLACVETQVSTGIPEPDERDCELLEWSGEEVFGKIAVPEL